QVCQNLFAHTPLALAKAVEWMRRSEEFVKRAAFVLVAVRAVHADHTDDCVFADLLPTVMAAADDTMSGRELVGRPARSENEAPRCEHASSTPSLPALTATAGASAGSPATYRASYWGPGSNSVPNTRLTAVSALAEPIPDSPRTRPER